MSVHYKFKSALDFDTITFDGLHISVSDLKKAIIHQKRLGKTADFDLQITNAQTKEEYTDDVTLIPKNTSLIIARIPLAVQPKKPWDPQADKVQGVRQVPEPDSGTLDLSQMNGTEEDKINAMMIQSTMDYDPNNYQKIRGQGQTGEVPANYRCFKCHKPGHWIKNCPLGSSGEPVDVKRNTGIPRSFIERDSHEKTAEQPQPTPPVPEKKQEIPEDLICSICKDLFTDAVMIPCCGSSFCDECVRTALLESEDNECPDCKEKGSSPGSLIPNRFLRNSVNAFKNETGYNKPRQRKEPPKPKETNISTTPNQAEHSDSNTTIAELASKENKTATVDEKDKDTIKEKKDQDGVEKKADAGALSSHDESDFEDNITVTIPPAHLQGPIAFKERQYNGRHSRHPKPPGLENSPKSGSVAHSASPREHRSGTPTVDEKETSSDIGDQPQKHHPVPSHQSSSRESSMRVHRSTPSDVYNNAPPITSYPQGQSMMGPARPYDMGVYGVPPGPGFAPFMMGDRMRGPYHPPRPGYPHMHQMRPRHMAPPGTLASVYQGVAAKVGPGIIDDPLEAFNRIMREKEKRKEERRRSPDRRRSRSIELNVGRLRHSPPPYNRGGRIRSPEERRLRTPPPRERRGRSREREKRSLEKDKRRHRSSSFSDRSSRSRSWSIPPRRRSKSPPIVRRRTRSRSPSFSMSRSRSRSNSQGRFRGPVPPMRYNRSPLRPISPRYRQKENRRPDRREEFPRDDFRERSPYHYQSRRPRSRGRMMSPAQHRQERPIHGQEQFYHPIPQMGMYNEAPYSQNNNRFSRDGPIMPHREPYGRDRNQDYKLERFDDGPPGTDEPPPPGFENSPERIRRNSWNHNQFDDHGYRDEYRKQDMNKKDYIDRAHTPELREIQSIEREERHRHEVREREGRSWSRTSRHSSNNTRRRKTRSRSPLRLERIPEHYSNRDRNLSKETHINRERFSQDRQALIEKERQEHEKQRERADRERKTAEKKHSERKAHEKESRHAIKEEKEREKVREQEKEKEKRRESSEEEKKDKKTKEKRKKKKEKDPEKKKKKERKEKEKKLKEKEKEKEKEEEKEIKEKEIEQEKEVNNPEVPTIETVAVEEIQQVEKPKEEVKELEVSKEAEEDSVSMREEGELPDDEEEDTHTEKDKEAEIIDLYGDICQEEEIRFDYPGNIVENSEIDSKLQKDANKISPTDIKRFDSVLDIHDFEPDLDDIARDDSKRDSNVLVPLPELSKWELDEENQSREEKRAPSIISEASTLNEEKTGKVTTEVIRRAENAIFARAINAIRPIEIKKISVERQKLYANEPSRDHTSPPSILLKNQSPNKDLPSFQITVPTNSNSSERSVEIKSEKSKKLTPVRSVKDRLGSKVTEPVLKRNRSRSNTPPRKVTMEGSRIEKVRLGRSRSRERHRVEENRDTRRVSEIKRANEANRSRERNIKDYKVPENTRNREQPRNRDNDRRREHVPERSRERQWEHERMRDRDKDREKEKTKERRGEQRRTPERNRDRPREPDKHLRDQDRIKEQQLSTSTDNKAKEGHRSKPHEKVKQIETRKDRSRSRSSEKKDKRNKREKDGKRKRGEEEKLQERDKRSKVEKVDKDTKESNTQRKKSIIDEASFVPDYDEQPDQEQLHKTNEVSQKKSERPSKEKIKSPDVNKRSRSASPSSSSSSSSESDSNSDSDDNNKKKKKRKHKKKKSKRASSAESASSPKHKRSKSKKKSKSSKKKKKNKK